MGKKKNTAFVFAGGGSLGAVQGGMNEKSDPEILRPHYH